MIVIRTNVRGRFCSSSDWLIQSAVRGSFLLSLFVSNFDVLAWLTASDGTGRRALPGRPIKTRFAADPGVKD